MCAIIIIINVRLDHRRTICMEKQHTCLTHIGDILCEIFWLTFKERTTFHLKSASKPLSFVYHLKIKINKKRKRKIINPIRKWSNYRTAKIFLLIASSTFVNVATYTHTHTKRKRHIYALMGAWVVVLYLCVKKSVFFCVWQNKIIEKKKKIMKFSRRKYWC